jgi:hypothetical protein
LLGSYFLLLPLREDAGISLGALLEQLLLQVLLQNSLWQASNQR